MSDSSFMVAREWCDRLDLDVSDDAVYDLLLKLGISRPDNKAWAVTVALDEYYERAMERQAAEYRAARLGYKGPPLVTTVEIGYFEARGKSLARNNYVLGTPATMQNDGTQRRLAEHFANR